MNSSLQIKFRSRISNAMEKDRPAFSRRLNTVLKKHRGGDPDENTILQLETLDKNIRSSVCRKRARLKNLPVVSYPEDLPITSRKDDIIEAVRNHQVVIIAGDTGSGKSTQIPKMCLEAGRGMERKIACTQPRRIAATTIAARIAEELGEEIGQSVGYKIRFKDRSGPEGYIKVMTDGMLLAETQQDPRLYAYDTIIVDEAHERSLNIDFILGILKTLLKKRQNLKVIITSATIDTEKFSAAFEGAPVIEVSGRRFPVYIEYQPIDSRLQEKGDVTYVDAAVKAVEKVCNRGAFGDILIFMPTEQDILETCDRLDTRLLKNTVALPLFSRLRGKQQRRVFQSAAGRKIVVATNIAETSLTIPGIRFVIDTGLARISKYIPRTRTTSLPVSSISRSSADQRKGRCGRLEDGICIRLYSEEDYDSRPEFTEPEILRSNLAEVILRMISLKLGNIGTFPFLDSPNPGSIKDGFDLLVELGAVVKKKGSAFLTDKGRLMARMPVDPKISRMIIEARKEGCVHDVAVIASALTIQDPRERPMVKAAQADQMHARFKDTGSDFITLLNLWNSYHRSWKTMKTQNKMRKFCREHFLSFPRMTEWRHVHQQITLILDQHGIPNSNSSEKVSEESRYAVIHRSILSGYLSNIAVKKEKNLYLAARGREVMIFPGSTLFNKGPEWIVAADMVKTTRLFARTGAKVDPEWLEALGGSLCKSSYSNPRWEKNRGEVRASEQVSLYGLLIVPQRSVAYGSINPLEAHDIFIRSGLVERNIMKKYPFLIHNRALIEKVSRMEDKVRRRGMLVSEEDLSGFYSEKLQGIRDTRTLEKTIRRRGGDDFLKMTEQDILRMSPDADELAQYPDETAIGRGTFKFAYKFAPGKPDDGITIKVPSSLAAHVSPEHLDWIVPGLFREKLTALIKGLAKKYRKQLVPVSNTVDVVLSEMQRTNEPLVSALGAFIYKRFGVDIPASEWPAEQIPEHLNMRVSLTDHLGRELRSGRDPSILREGAQGNFTKEPKPDLWEKAKLRWEKSGVTSWSFGELPESISLAANLFAFPGLEPAGKGVNIRLFRDRNEALKAHKKGVKTLFLIYFKKDLNFVKKTLKFPGNISKAADYFGGMNTVEKAVYGNLTDRLFHLNLRNETAFQQHASATGPSLLSESRSFMELTGNVIEAYFHTRQVIHGIETSNRNDRHALDLCARLRKELGGLVPRDFLERYGSDRLAQLPRYLKAMEIRVERGCYDKDKERKKTSSIAPFMEALRKNIKELSPRSSFEKRQGLEEFFWMVEEFKVSLFAQELKTPFPVSAKRLEKKLRELERMI